MEKQSKNLENIKIKGDSLQVTLKETNVNYQGLEVKKDVLNVKHCKFQGDYKNMEEILLK
jgi:hypothetical protein